MPESTVDPKLDLHRLEEIVADAISAVEAAPDLETLERLDSMFLGKSSALADANRKLRYVAPEKRPEAGRRIAELRRTLEEAVLKKRRDLESERILARLAGERIDVTLPSPAPRPGRLHVLDKVTEEIVDIFVGMGYSVAEGREVETDYYNFEALNTPKWHPARSMHDTLYLDTGRGEEVLLRTHTSPVQVHVMEARRPPLFMISPGRVFRRDTLDPTHSPVFHQVEGLAVDREITLGDLAGTLEHFVKEFFGEGERIRMLPSYFPFTEPSVEVAMSCFACSGSGCSICGRSGWIEVLGAGMVDPKVFEAVGYDAEEWQGFAFGMGVERLAMLRYGIPDIRLFYENDLRFLSQF
ncbi:MAG: phenylalanine--tRNA ligase subunit alpha [Acidimicrobiia bacterium]